MTFPKSKCWLPLLSLLIVPKALAANLYPIAEVGNRGWVNVRRGEGSQSPVIGRVRHGDSFAVQSAGSHYLILDGPFAGGSIAAEFVRLTDVQYPLFKSTANEVSIRASPSLNGQIVARINTNTYFTAEKNGEWFAVKAGPFKGRFVNGNFVQPIDETANTANQATPVIVEPSAPEESLSVKLSGSNIRMRKFPGTTGKIAGVLKGNETLEVEKKGDWCLIKSGPHKGNFIKADFVSPLESTPVVAAMEKKPAQSSSAPAPGWDEKSEQRFNEGVAKVFKKKKNLAESNQVLMPVYYEQFKNPTGNVNTRVIDSQEIEIESTEFFKILRKHVADAWFEKPQIMALTPKGNTGSLQWIPISAFKESGINVYYDELKLEIHLLIPPELRGTTTLSLSGKGEIWEGENLESSSLFSTYLNINATETFDSRNTSFDDRRSPLQAQLESGTNISNFVIEAYGNYTENRGDQAEGKNAFTRQDVRVVRDLLGITSRASVGDVVYPVQSFQVFRPMKGVAIYRQFSMSSSKVTYPTGDREVYLKNKSKVYIWVNDQLQKMLELPAGRHQLKDFQYTSGMNNVRFEIVDEFGQTEIQDHSYTASSELLKPGLHQFSYAAGSPSSAEPGTGVRIYDSTNDTFSAFHRYGFNNYFSGGLNAQVDSKQSIFGIEGNFSLETGYLKIECGQSTTADVGNGYALASSYTYVDYLGKDQMQRSYSAGLTLRSDYFSEFGTTVSPTVARPLNLTLGHSRGLTKMLSANFGLNYTINKKITADTHNSSSLRVGLSNRWNNGISLNVSASHSQTSAGRDEISIMGIMIWSFPKERQTISAYSNSADSSSRVGWNYSPSSGADSASYQANFRETQTEKGYGATAAINGNRVRASATHEVVLTKRDEPSTTVVESDHANSVTTLQMGTALVFAGGRFGIGRPVTDSFAIIAPIKSLKGQPLLVNPDSEGNYIAKSSWLGPAVMSEIASYNPTSLIVGSKDLPLGVSIPQDHFNLYPRYKNGYAFPLGTDANVYLVAALADSQGQPLGMTSGLAIHLDDTTLPPVTVFTSRKGILQSEGFRSGRYRLEIGSDKYQPLEFVVPEDATEEYNLGTLMLKDK